MRKKYAVDIVQEGAIGTLFLGSSYLSEKRIEEVLNNYADQGWFMEFMVIERRRMLLFWERETAIITFSKEY